MNRGKLQYKEHIDSQCYSECYNGVSVSQQHWNKSIRGIMKVLDCALTIYFNKSAHLAHKIQSLVLVSCEIKPQMIRI